MSDKKGAPSTEVETVKFSGELLQQFGQMAMTIPAEDGAGAERIVAAVLAAESVDDLDAPWDTTKAEKLAGRVLRIDGLMRRPSDFRSGLGVFLVVHSVDTATGEKVVWTTGSVSIVAQLARAYNLNGLPVYAELVIAERPTQDGYHPHHLKFYGPPPTMPAGNPEDHESAF